MNLQLSVKKTRKQVFPEQMEAIVPWNDLVSRIAPYYPEGRTGRPPFSLHTMLRVHFMQQWFTLSDPGMEEAFFDTPLYREFAQLDDTPACLTRPLFCVLANPKSTSSTGEAQAGRTNPQCRQ